MSEQKTFQQIEAAKREYERWALLQQQLKNVLKLETRAGPFPCFIEISNIVRVAVSQTSDLIISETERLIREEIAVIEKRLDWVDFAKELT